MLWAAEYYWPGTDASPCYRWPASTCDGPPPPGKGPGFAPTDPSSANFYIGSNPGLKPGALLAVPPALAPGLELGLETVLGSKMLRVLTDFGVRARWVNNEGIASIVKTKRNTNSFEPRR